MLQALYRGNGANVLRLVPEVALKFGFNDQLKIMFTPADGKPMSFSRKLAAGATAGVLKVILCRSSPLFKRINWETKVYGSLTPG